MSEQSTNIYDLIVQGEIAYAKPISIEDGWYWSLKSHLRRSFLYLNSQFEDKNEDRNLRPNKNIILPIMNVHYRSEGFDVKDIMLYVDSAEEYYKSLLINKYHTNWALKNSIDTFIDEMTEGYCNYGGVLVKKTNEARPEVIDLRNLAFCNQIDILAYPFAIRHKYSPSQLRKANKKWGQTEYGATIDIEGLIALAKKEDKTEIEVFEVHGLMPTEWLRDNDPDNLDEDEKDTPQIQVVSFYKKENGDKQGVTLFKHKEPELEFKFLARDGVEGRAVGRGGIEDLFESQVWTNWDEIKITEMLNSASKTIHWSDDPSFKAKNNLGGVENNEVLALQKDSKFQQVDTYPRNLQVFNDSVERWQQQAQFLGSATEALMGVAPTAGTPFKLYEAQQIEGKGMHQYRQGKLATFMDEIYRDWILPHIAKEVCKEQNFMQDLSADEMRVVVDKVMTKKANEFKKRMILGMQDIDEEMVNLYKETVKADVLKKGNSRFFNILKDEMKDITFSVKVSIAGKQKNLALFTDKLVGIFRQYLEMKGRGIDTTGLDPILNQILESSGLSPIMFGYPNSPQPQQIPTQQAQPQMAQPPQTQ